MLFKDWTISTMEANHELYTATSSVVTFFWTWRWMQKFVILASLSKWLRQMQPTWPQSSRALLVISILSKYSSEILWYSFCRWFFQSGRFVFDFARNLWYADTIPPSSWQRKVTYIASELCFLSSFVGENHWLTPELLIPSIWFYGYKKTTWTSPFCFWFLATPI